MGYKNGNPLGCLEGVVHCTQGNPRAHSRFRMRMEVVRVLAFKAVCPLAAKQKKQTPRDQLLASYGDWKGVNTANVDGDAAKQDWT